MGKRFNADDIRDSIDTERLVRQARDSAAAARRAAQDAQEWATPYYEDAREWAKPRAKKAYRMGARKAVPLVEGASDRAERWADAAHAAIVGSIIPAVVSAARGAAEPERERDRGPNWGAILIPTVLAVAAGAAVVAWAKRDPGPDHWAEGDEDEWEFVSDQRRRLAKARTSINEAVTAAEDAVKHAAALTASAAGSAYSSASEAVGPTVDKVKDEAVKTSKKVADAAGPTAKKVRDEAVKTSKKVANSASAQGKKVAKSASAARAKAEAAVDDVEDVWEDEK